MLLIQLIEEGTAELERCGVEAAATDALLLLGHCLNMNRSQLFLSAKEPVSDEAAARFRSFIRRRAEREPYAYIVSEREFWSLPFFVNRNVLIPRPETEFLLEKVFAEVKRRKININNCIDLCCGSGIIAVVLALELGSKVLALDLSENAIDVAKVNVARHGVENLVTPVVSDLFSAVEKGDYPLIVSNPPYVKKMDIKEELEPEVAAFEPLLALDGGDDGLDCIRRIATDSLSFLAQDGVLCMEFGCDQGREVQEIFSAAQFGGKHFSKVRIYQDYSGRDRVLVAEAQLL